MKLSNIIAVVIDLDLFEFIVLFIRSMNDTNKLIIIFVIVDHQEILFVSIFQHRLRS